MTIMLKTVGRLGNLRRIPGAQGRIKHIPSPDGFKMYMMADGSNFFPFPTTMKVQWDGEIPTVRSSTTIQKLNNQQKVGLEKLHNALRNICQRSGFDIW
jgi:hypothetical protein